MEIVRENIFKPSDKEQSYEFKFGDWRDQWCKDASIDAYFGKHDTSFEDQVFWGKYSNLAIFFDLHRPMHIFNYYDFIHLKLI